MTPKDFDEKSLVELPAEQRFQELDYDTEYGPDLHPGKPNQARNSLTEVLLKDILREKLEEFNPGLDNSAYEQAITHLEGLTHPDIIQNNREFHKVLLAGIKIPAADKLGKVETRALKIIDFDSLNNPNTPNKNHYLAVRQFWVKQLDTKIPDHVVFLNGIPLAILEYKDPTNKGATIRKAFHQLGETDYQRYIPRLFHYNAFVVISDRASAKYGTITAPYERFSEWKDTEQLEGATNKLDMLISGMFEKQTFLNIIKNFIEFESDGKQIIKKIAQQHQFSAVMKLIEKSKKVRTTKDENRIGVVWHTTGSGKSLTMIFYAQMLSQVKEFDNPTFVVLTDRNDLDEQITNFFEVAGFPNPRAPTSILEAEGIQDLRDKLKTPAGKIIFTTIQKFQTTEEEKTGNIKYPVISDRRNIIIIADEAHRSQYKKMAINLQTALPNALRVGFTGTPIDLEDRSTTDTFGPVVSSYKIPDAVRDNATVQIAYEGKRVDLHLLNRFIGKDFEEITGSLDEDQTESLTKKWTDVKRLVEDPDRVNVIAGDIVDHFTKRQELIEGKAMLVATTRRGAKMYKDVIDKIPGHPESIVVISGRKRKKVEGAKETKDDELQDHIRSKAEVKQIIRDFKKEDNPVKLLIVCDMFLTGFDAPLLHTMYVDKPLRDHNLIQAISRVNRIWKDKPSGLIVDYIGITDELRKSLKAFAEGDVKDAMIPTSEIIKLMKQKHEELLGFFECNMSDYTIDKTEESDLLFEASSEVCENDELKKWFFEGVAELTKAFAVCSPNPACLEIENDLRRFQTVKRIIAKGTKDAPEISDEIDSAVKELVETGIAADTMVKQYSLGTKQPEIVDLDEKFLSKIKPIKHKNLKAELANKLLDDAITAKFSKNAVKRKEFQEKLEQALNRYHSRQANIDTTIDEIGNISQEVQETVKRNDKLGLNEQEIVFYDAVLPGRDYVESDEQLLDVARKLTDYIRKSITVDWTDQESKVAEMKSEIRRILKSCGFSTESFEKIVPTIMTQAEENYG